MDRARLDRGLKQRLFLLEVKTRGEFAVQGTSGNVYTVKIKDNSSCTCPDHMVRKNICKHICFILFRVLRCPDKYRKESFTKREIGYILRRAPAHIAPSEDVLRKYERIKNGEEVEEPEEELDVGGVKQKPIEQGDACPICFEDFMDTTDRVIYCQAQCGNNIHQLCFDQWVASTRKATCVMCRSPWSLGATKKKGGGAKKEGIAASYVNLLE